MSAISMLSPPSDVGPGPQTRFHDGRNWIFEKRFGLFVHWGLYALDGRQEQAWLRYGMESSAYCALQERFRPRAFDPDAWLDLATAAGMDYLVFTTKHHDGFCLWNTKETSFNVMNTPWGRDICADVADACQRRGFPLEWYYSVVDWHHPKYPNLGRHHEIVTDPAGHDWPGYLRFLENQLAELCSGYGTIHGIWWDMNVPEYRDPGIHARIRRRQPAAVFNNRGFDDGDYGTPERGFDPEDANRSSRSAWRSTEACESIGVNSWGYRADEDYFSSLHLMRAIDRQLCDGGRYLLNVGPDADGRIPRVAGERLRRIGDWYHAVRESFGEPCPGYTGEEKGRIQVTRSADNLYIHCPDGLAGDTLSLTGLPALPMDATLLNDGATLGLTNQAIVYWPAGKPVVRIRGLPVEKLSDTVPVIRLRYPGGGLPPIPEPVTR